MTTIKDIRKTLFVLMSVITMAEGVLITFNIVGHICFSINHVLKNVYHVKEIKNIIFAFFIIAQVPLSAILIPFAVVSIVFILTASLRKFILKKNIDIFEGKLIRVHFVYSVYFFILLSVIAYTEKLR